MSEVEAITFLTEEFGISEAEAKLMHGFATGAFKGDATNQHGVDPFIVQER